MAGAAPHRITGRFYWLQNEDKFILQHVFADPVWNCKLGSSSKRHGGVRGCASYLEMGAVSRPAALHLLPEMASPSSPPVEPPSDCLQLLLQCRAISEPPSVTALSRRLFVALRGQRDGHEMSNTAFFDQSLGWRGMLIEANPDDCVPLKRNRCHAARDNVISCAAVCTEAHHGSAAALQSRGKTHSSLDCEEGWNLWSVEGWIAHPVAALQFAATSWFCGVPRDSPFCDSFASCVYLTAASTATKRLVSGLRACQQPIL